MKFQSKAFIVCAFLFSLFSLNAEAEESRTLTAKELKLSEDIETIIAATEEKHSEETEEPFWNVPAAAIRFYVNWFQNSEDRQLPNAPFKVLKNDGKKIQVQLGNFAQIKKRLKENFLYRFYSFTKALFSKQARQEFYSRLFLTPENTAISKDFWKKGENLVYYQVFYNNKFLEKGVGRNQIEIETPSSGNYTFYIYEINPKFFEGYSRVALDDGSDIGNSGGRDPLWVQTIRVDSDDRILSIENQERLAKHFSPILNLADDEKYYPTTRGYIANKVDKNEKLDKTPVFFQLPHQKMVFSVEFKDVLDVMIGFGDDNLVVDTKSIAEVFKYDPQLPNLMRKRYGKNHSAVHYRFVENIESIDLHFEQFFTYDPKKGTEENPDVMGHIIDRESSTLTFRKKEIALALKNGDFSEKIAKGEILPIHVTYGSHINNQTKRLLKKNETFSAADNIIFEWNTEGAKLTWDKVPKIDSHPIIFLAIGSHANYPYKATDERGYSVVMLQGLANVLFENAGGSKLLIPEEISKSLKKSNSFEFTSYELIRLNFDEFAIPNSQIVDGFSEENCAASFDKTRAFGCRYIKEAVEFNISKDPTIANESNKLIKNIHSLMK